MAFFRSVRSAIVRGFSSNTTSHRKVAVLGAAGGIGQPLSLLLKESPALGHLALYDIANIGMAADISHISTRVKVSGHSGEAELPLALKDAEIVLIPAGVPRKPGMTRDDLFATNANIVRGLVKACAENCPEAWVLVISNPVNSTVPIAYETMKAAGVKHPRVLGVTTLDIVRAKTFVAETKGLDPQKVEVNVIGGHSGVTIIPLFEPLREKYGLSETEIKTLTQRVQYGGDEVVKAKAGAGSATLSMAYAAREFFNGLVDAIDGGNTTRQIAYVKDPMYKDTGYFAGPIEIDGTGQIKTLSLPEMSAYEKELYNIAIVELVKDVKKGEEFANRAKS